MPAGPVNKVEIATAELLDRVQASIRELVVAHLRTRAVSLSSLDSFRTGNRYQSVQLGTVVEPGFRLRERFVFAGLQIEKRTVVDLGCNLGEICRDAVRSGASRATGLEYDPYFIQMARYITAYNGLNGIDFHQVDLTGAEAYSGQYDFVLALSVYRYIKKHLGRVAAMTKRILVIETHGVDADWREEYLEPLQRHFEHVVLAGFSEHKAKSKAEVRYLLLASNKPLDGALAKRARDLATRSAPFTLDTLRSSVPHYDAFLAQVGLEQGSTLPELIDASRRTWPDLTAEIVRDAVAITRDVVRTPLYWAAFLQGYAQYSSSRKFDFDNIYFKVFQLIIQGGFYSGALSKLMETPADAMARLALRYVMIDDWNEGRTAIGDPIILYTIVDHPAFSQQAPWRLHVSPADELVTPLAIDGHHRLFLAYAAGAEAVPFLPMWSPSIPPVRAAIRRDPALENALWSGVYPLSQKLWR